MCRTGKLHWREALGKTKYHLPRDESSGFRKAPRESEIPLIRPMVIPTRSSPGLCSGNEYVKARDRPAAKTGPPTMNFSSTSLLVLIKGVRSISQKVNNKKFCRCEYIPY